MNLEKEASKVNDDSIAFMSLDKYTMNSELDNEYKEMISPIDKRLWNAVGYNACVVFGYYYFSRNIVYFRGKKSMSNISNFKILRTTLFYTFIPFALMLPNVFILFGLHPIKYFKDRKKVEDRLLMSGELKDTFYGMNKMYKRDIASAMVESDD